MLAGFPQNSAPGFRGPIYCAQAIVTAPVIWSTAAATGGPLLYNPTTSGVTAHILGVSFALTVASTVSGSLGFTGGVTTAPTSTTAITSSGRIDSVGATTTPKCSVYNVGTVSAAGTFFLPLAAVNTGAITTDTTGGGFIHLGGSIEVPATGSFLSVAGSATLTTAVIQIGLVWMEVANN